MMNRLFGLIGYPLGHSFSQQYFSEKFFREGITDARFELFPIPHISKFPELILQNPSLEGLSVTIPYKESVIVYLDHLDEIAASVGAVNSIRVGKKKLDTFLFGYNTDVYGFEKSLNQIRLPRVVKALVLGTGGASKAVGYVLAKKGIDFQKVSRNPSGPGQISYDDLNKELLEEHLLLINTTPLGTYPDIGQCPPIPYELLTADHILYDLVYNPGLTLFLKQGQLKGCKIKNGESMLVYQAQKSWEIWNSGSRS